MVKIQIYFFSKVFLTLRFSTQLNEILLKVNTDIRYKYSIWVSLLSYIKFLGGLLSKIVENFTRNIIVLIKIIVFINTTDSIDKKF